MKEQVLDFLKTHILPEQTILVAVSGGVDSMVLLDIVRQYIDSSFIVVATIDHKVRDDSSIAVDCVQHYCQLHNLGYCISTLDWKEGEKISEETMREKRYTILRELKKKHHAQYILNAHHQDDHIETFLFRMIRGSGLRGLTSFKNSSGDILRPLFSFNKEEIIQYARENNISWVEDSTNQQNIYARNHIRNVLIPEIKKIHPTAQQNIAQVIYDLQEWHSVHINFIENWLYQNPIPFHCETFLLLPDIIQREILQHIAQRCGKVLSRGHMQEVLEIIKAKKGNKKTFISDEYYFGVYKNQVFLKKI